MREKDVHPLQDLIATKVLAPELAVSILADG
jgi:hypothetical protein